MKVTSVSVVCTHVRLTTAKVPTDFLIDVGIWTGRQGITACLTADEALELAGLLAKQAANMIRSESHRKWQAAQAAKAANAA